MKKSPAVKILKYLNSQGFKDTDIAKRLDVSRAAISQLRTRNSGFDDEACLKLAVWLGVNPLFLIALMRSHIAEDLRVQTFWKRAAQELASNDKAKRLLAL